MSKALQKTVFHTLEVLVAIGVALFVLQYFGVDSQVGQVAIAALAVALPKLLRASDLPVGDYVNER